MKTSLETYRYQLEQGSKKHRCPSCGKKRFVRYVDIQTDKYLPESYGRCDREVNCGYHVSPYSDSYAKDNFKKDNWRNFTPKPPTPKKFIPVEMLKRSMSNYSENNFVKYLLSLFDKKTVKAVVRKYCIGTSQKVSGGGIFYQIGSNKKIRRGKIMVYDSHGHKKAFNTVHAQLGWSDHLPDWRFFGEHLLTRSDKPVAIVESEKTAVIASIYLPEFTWLATGTKSTLKRKYGEALAGRDILLFPDLGAYADWQDNDLHEIANVTLSTLLEDHASKPEIAAGYDIADYLIEIDSSTFADKNRPLESKYEDIASVIGTLSMKEFNRRYESYPTPPF